METNDVPAPTGDPSGDGLAAAVRESVQRLSHSAREVILLRYFSGLSHERIAGLLNISTHAVHGRLTRARRKLADDLKRNGLPRSKS
jgi:RNA polymerase sigma-70 factor (ECF subfamily)